MGCTSSKVSKDQQRCISPNASPAPNEKNATNPLAGQNLESQSPHSSAQPLVTTSPQAALPHDVSTVSAKSQLKKARTTQIGKDEVDFMVLQFLCHDDGAVTHLGRGAKESSWRVQVGRDGQPISIKLHVDRTLVGSPEVGIECDGTRIFPEEDNRTKMKLREDFCQQWPFRGVVKSVGVKDLFEIKASAYGPDCDQWYLATLTRQRPDGLFEAAAWIPDGRGGVKELSYPAVPASNIRYRASGKPLSVPERVLMLQVPAQDPLHATLCVDGSEMITNYFARPTPHPASADAQPRILVEVSKDRQQVELNVGHAVFSHFLTNEARLVRQSADKRKHSWTIQVGPFTEHTIEIERHWASRLVTLTVDGEKFIEASAEDLDCQQEYWECKFRFVGERLIAYNVYETNLDGDPLDTKGVVSQKVKFVRECLVSVYDESDLARAELVVDDVPFRDLPLKREVHPESNVSISSYVLQATYDITLPYKTNMEAPCGGLNAYTNAVAQSLGDLQTLVLRDGTDAVTQSLDGLRTLVLRDGEKADSIRGAAGLQSFLQCCTQPSSMVIDEHDSDTHVPVVCESH